MLLVGAALVLVAAGQAWVTYRLAAMEPFPSERLSQTGAQLASSVRTLALLALAAVAAVVATRGVARVVIGAVVALAGMSMIRSVTRVLLDPGGVLAIIAPLEGEASVRAAPYVALLGAVLIVMAGLLVVVRGRTWGSMSSRYDAPAQKQREPSMWDALDRGEDPTDEGPHTGR
jgi:uncharacterized membrane protein (TIGR02234 family)